MASHHSFVDDEASLASSRDQLCDVYATIITLEVSVHEPENNQKTLRLSPNIVLTDVDRTR